MHARHVSDMPVFKFTYTDDLSNEMLVISPSKVCKLESASRFALPTANERQYNMALVLR
jgi:hypothetical protein